MFTLVFLSDAKGFSYPSALFSKLKVVGCTFHMIDIRFRHAHKPCELFVYCRLAGGYVARILPPMAETGITTPVGPGLVMLMLIKVDISAAL